MGYGARWLGVLICLVAPSAARAQLAPVGVPPGVLRFELDGGFDSWDKRFLDGTKQSLAADFASSALGSTLFPGLASSELILQRVTGLPEFRLNLGTLTGDAQADVATATLGLALGLNRFMTVFGRLPVSRARSQTDIDLSSTGANAGINPGAPEQEAFFTEFDGALAALEARIAAGDYDANPTQRALADATLADGSALFDDLFTLLVDPATASTFVPTESSDAGIALDSRIAALQSTLAAGLGVPGFAATPALAAGPASDADLEGYVGDPLGPIGVEVGESEVRYRGDAEVGLAFTLADRWDQGDRRGGFRAAAEGLVRLPTGVRPRLDRALAIGTGDKQTDLEVRGVVDLGSGNIGVRLEGGYNRQLEGSADVLVAPRTQPFAPRTLRHNVRLDPGDVVTLAVRPFFRLARSLALIGSVELWSKGEDAADYGFNVGGLPDLGVVTAGTDASATVASIGLTYSNPGSLRPGGTGLPVDAGWTYERVVSASGGVVPDVHRVRARLRLYFGIW